MTIKLYHCKDARSLRPLWALEEMGLEYELINMAFPPRQKFEGYKLINPLGTVPTMIDGEVTITESVAICQYLADRYRVNDLTVSIDDPDYGSYLNWLHRSDATLTFPQTLILRYAIFETPERRNSQVADDYQQWFLARLRSVERALISQDYLCANRFTLADICVGYAIYLASKLGMESDFGDHTKAYLQRLISRPGFLRSMEKQSELADYF